MGCLVDHSTTGIERVDQWLPHTGVVDSSIPVGPVRSVSASVHCLLKMKIGHSTGELDADEDVLKIDHLCSSAAGGMLWSEPMAG